LGGVPDETFRPPFRLTGNHVELVPLEGGHIPSLVPGLLDPATVEFLREPPDPTADSARAWLLKRIERLGVDDYLPLATVWRATGEPVGVTSFLRLDRPSRGVEIGGTWLRKDLWQTPLNTEAKWLMLRYAFEIGHLHRVQLQTDQRNLRSQRAIERLGAVPEARLREDVRLPDGSFRTSVYYSILESEWPSVRRRLEAFLLRPWTPVGRDAPELPSEPLAAPTARPRRPPPPPPKFRRPLTLTGTHVRLDPLERADLPGLTQAGADPRIWSLLRIRHGDTPEGMAGLVEELLGLEARGEVLPLVVRTGDPARIVGIARYLDISRDDRWVEVGTWLTPEVWRTPVNTELKYLLFRHAFETEGVHRVQLKTDDRNSRSLRAIERLGAMYEGRRRDHYRFPDGLYRTSAYFSVLESEWPTVRDRLESLLRRPWEVPTRPDASPNSEQGAVPNPRLS
jgi:RimJ/RimL family protein N-acetyltransferase